MSGLFSKPKMPTVQPPPPQPIVDQVQVDRALSDFTRRRKGRAATDLASAAPSTTGTAGAVGSPVLGS